ncbi:ABC transporter substrate-binding protein [Paenibacillus sp. GCM10012303]|uniref:ABC transporter substrate-binding protein n=1 Tax=Paenibacillus sp. GCM10012303 TaxID=3317340 RepID=UPI003618B841
MIKKPIVLLVTAVSMLAGCSGGQDSKTGQTADSAAKTWETPKEPVTISFYLPYATDTATFMEQYGNAIVKKFPHVTLKLVNSPDTNVAGNLSNLLASQEPIDIFLNGDTNHYRYITPFKFQYDITDMIKRSGYDLKRLEPSTLEAVKALSPNGEIYALPLRMNVMSLLYNKDLFDKFAVPYPTDGMTWDETYELAKRLTRKDGDTQYRGFITQSYSIAWQNQMSLGFADPKTDKPLFSSDERWSQFVKNINRFYEIPGNALLEGSFGGINNLFYSSKVAAMYAASIPGTAQQVNWDLVTLPEISNLRGIGSQASLNLAYIPSISKHKEQAFEIIAYMTSDEYQTDIAKKALGLPVITTQSAKDAFGQDNPNLAGKNLKALTKNKPAAPFQQSPYQAITNNQLEKLWYQLGKGQLDINTTLRMADENAVKEIEKLKSGQ